MHRLIKSAVVAAALVGGTPAQAQIKASATIDTNTAGVRIAPEIYGQFAEQLGSGIDGGIWVGEDSTIPNIRGYRRDVVEALKRLHVPVVRWPGGCYADIYHWRDGIGPRAKRPVTINTTWGNAEQRNQFGTHEFFDFAELIDARAYLTVNVGSGSIAEARDWVEYVTSDSQSTLAGQRRANGRGAPWKIEYIGIGNESWGCGGNFKAEEYATVMRQYAGFLRSGPKLVAVGPAGADVHWTEVLMNSRDSFDAIAPHNYTLPTGRWDNKGPATGFSENEWRATFAETRKMEPLIEGNEAVMDKVDPERKVALAIDEWGTWYDPSPGSNPAYLVQDNTLRDALVAATNFHIFHRHVRRVRMANIAQMVNVLQAMILTDGPKIALTPTYYAFLMYQPFQGAAALPVTVASSDYGSGAARVPAVDVTAARNAGGTISIGLINVDPNQRAEVQLAFAGKTAGAVQGQVLTATRMDSQNPIGGTELVRPVGFNGARWHDGKLRVEMPAKSLVVLEVQ